MVLLGPLRDMGNLAQFSDYVLWVFVMINRVSGACALSSALPGRKTVKRLATIATEYVVVKQGMYVEWGKHA